MENKHSPKKEAASSISSLTLSEAQPSHSPLLMLVLCSLAAIGFFSTSIYLPSLPSIEKSLKVSQDSIQFTLTAFYLGSVVGSLLLGPLSDRIGRLLVIKFALILFITSSFLCAQTHTIFGLQMGRLLQGIAGGGCLSLVRAIGRDLYEGPDLTKFSGTIMTITGAALIIAPLLGGIVEFYSEWQKTFYLLTLLGIFIFFMVWQWLPETSSHTFKKPSSPLKNYVLLLKDSYYVVLCIILGFQMVASFCYVTLAPYIFISHFGWLPYQYGCANIAVIIGSILGADFARRMAYRLSIHKGILIGNFACFLLSLVFIGICFFFPLNPYLFMVYMTCFFISSPLIAINASSGAINIFPHIAGTAAALIGVIQNGSGILSSLVASVIPVSPLLLSILMGGLSLLGLLVGILIEAFPKRLNFTHKLQ